MPLVPQGVLSSLGKAMLLPLISTLSVSGSSESSPKDSLKISCENCGGTRKPPSWPAASLLKLPGAAAPMPLIPPKTPSSRRPSIDLPGLSAWYTACMNSPNDPKPRLGSASRLSVTIGPMALPTLIRASSAIKAASRSIAADVASIRVRSASNATTSSSLMSRLSAATRSVRLRASLTSVVLRA